jgi:membrane associated rhomboid family serine protease
MITYLLIAITVITSVLTFGNQKLFSEAVFNPFIIDSRKQYYRFISAGFIHADWMHLLFNMYALYLFGTNVEIAFKEIFQGFGTLAYVVLYFSALIMSSMFSYFKNKENPRYNAVGASGAVSAVLFVSIILFPSQKLMIFPIPFFIPSYILGPMYLVYSYYMGRKGTDNIGHDSHLFGALWGVLFIIVLWKDALSHFVRQVF